MDKPIMVRVNPSVHERLAKVAEADQRTVAMTVRRAIDKGLPLLEEEISQRGAAEAAQD